MLMPLCNVIKKKKNEYLYQSHVRRRDTLVIIITYLLASQLSHFNSSKSNWLYLESFFCVSHPLVANFEYSFEMPVIIQGKQGGARKLFTGRHSYKTTYTYLTNIVQSPLKFGSFVPIGRESREIWS